MKTKKHRLNVCITSAFGIIYEEVHWNRLNYTYVCTHFLRSDYGTSHTISAGAIDKRLFYIIILYHLANESTNFFYLYSYQHLKSI